MFDTFAARRREDFESIWRFQPTEKLSYLRTSGVLRVNPRFRSVAGPLWRAARRWLLRCSPAVAPDRLAPCTVPRRGRQQLFEVDFAGKSKRPDRFAGDQLAGVFSHDGREIVFGSSRMEIKYCMPAAGASARLDLQPDRIFGRGSSGRKANRVTSHRDGNAEITS